MLRTYLENQKTFDGMFVRAFHKCWRTISTRSFHYYLTEKFTNIGTCMRCCAAATVAADHNNKTDMTEREGYT